MAGEGQFLIDLSNYDSLLVQSTQSRSGTPDGNIFFNTTTGEIEFIREDELATIDLSSKGGAVDADNPLDVTLGIKFEAIYAFENQERRIDETLRKFNRWTSGTFKFGGAYNFINSRKPSLAGDRSVIRGSGWNEYASDGGTDRTYFGNKGLANIETASQPYNMLSSSVSPDLNALAPTDYAKTGQIDEAVQVFGDTANTPSDSTAYEGSVATAPAQTITIVAATGTFTRTAGDYLIDGFEPGHKFLPSGLDLGTNSTDIFTVDTVTALVITVIADDWVNLTDETGDADEELTVNGFDTRAYQAVSVRTFGFNYDRKDTVNDLGIAELGGYSTGFAVAESGHLTTGNYALADVYTAAIAPFDTMTLEKLAVPVTRDEFSDQTGTYTFTWVLNNPGTGSNAVPVDSGDLDQMVALLDALSQDDTDIDSGSETVTYGKRVGTWYSYNAQGQVVTASGADSLGLYMYNVPTADQQRVVMTDDGGTVKAYSFKVQVEAEVGATAKADVLAWYHSYFAAAYDTAGAIPVQDDSTTEIKGNASTADGSNKIIFTFDYTGDTVGGPADSDKDCVFLCEGDGGAVQAKTLYTITQQTTVAFACAPGVENNA